MKRRLLVYIFEVTSVGIYIWNCLRSTMHTERCLRFWSWSADN